MTYASSNSHYHRARQILRQTGGADAETLRLLLAQAAVHLTAAQGVKAVRTC